MYYAVHNIRDMIKAQGKKKGNAGILFWVSDTICQVVEHYLKVESDKLIYILSTLE